MYFFGGGDYEMVLHKDFTIVVTYKIDPKYRKTAHHASRSIGNKAWNFLLVDAQSFLAIVTIFFNHYFFNFPSWRLNCYWSLCWILIYVLHHYDRAAESCAIKKDMSELQGVEMKQLGKSAHSWIIFLKSYFQIANVNSAISNKVFIFLVRLSYIQISLTHRPNIKREFICRVDNAIYPHKP